MSTPTPRTNAECGPSSLLVDAAFARQLETELASVQLELGATKGELAAANASKDAISKRAEAIRCQFVESTKREAQLRAFVETIPLARWQYIENGGMADDALKLLKQPAPPVVPLADVKPLIDALARCYDAVDWPADGTSKQEIALANFTAKYPQS